MTALPKAFLRIPLAHRALHDVARGRPENSCAAIIAAMDRGYGIEIDLQPSLDGAAMVFHDYDLERLTHQKGEIRQQEATALSETLLKGSDEGIPGLSDVFDLVAGKVPVLLELKDQQGQMGPTDGRLEEATARCVEGYEGPLAVMSFNPHMVARLSEILPEVPRGLVTGGFRAQDWPELDEDVRARLRGIPDYDRVGACFISHHVKDLSSPRVAELRDRGAAVLCWTVRSPEEASHARPIAANITFEGFLPPVDA
ncbi:MAG: glycerophosphodiester phosphodiesterase family protein [Pseudomonadota bacterium]